MTNTKVTVPKEVAAELKHLYKNGLHTMCNLTEVFNGGSKGKYANTFKWAHSNYSDTKDNLPKLIQALDYGYEVEKSPEDLLREFYGEATENLASKERDDRLEGATQRITIRKVLRILGKEVDGIK